jgi:2-polyprenyl-3-methyl-5-hydroxy-6-metoxy-1,4-benzoquinol methylase
MDPADLSLNRIFDAFTGYQRTAALKAAIEIDLFTAIGSGVTTLPALASRCGAAERGVRSLANRLVVDGFLTKDGEHYGLAPDAAVFLDGGSAACVGSMIHFLTAPRIRAAFDSLTAAVRRGGTALDQEGTLEPNHPVWVEFARAMAPAARMTAEVLAMLLGHQGPLRGSVLDVAAGHGFFGITLARYNPELRIVALDWPAVLEVAAENAREAGVTERFTRRAGSAFDVDWGTGHAVVLLTNFLHHFEPETCETLLRRTRAALAPRGRAVVVEFVTDDSRVNPPAAAVFSLTMLASTPAGDAYTLREYERMFAAAGFSGVEMHQLAPTPQQVLLATA